MFERISVDVCIMCFLLMFLEKVISIEKMEDTSLLPNPIIVSIRSKTAFQFIELKERDALVENLLQRLKEVNSSNPVHCNNLQSKNQVLNFSGFLNYEFLAFIHQSVVLLFSGISFSLVLCDAFGFDQYSGAERTHGAAVGCAV